jgi:hypothetical protein
MAVNDGTPDAQTEKRLSRRGLMGRLGVGALAGVAGLSLLGGGQAEAQFQQGLTDVDILNFALNLEYLEAEFYLQAANGQRLPADLTYGVSGQFGPGRRGATFGGQKVPFLNPLVMKTAQELAVDELAHVKFLRSVLGNKAIPKPAINLNAAGYGFADDVEFLVLSRNFEDTGVSAYGGAAPFIRDKDVLGAAARILATEAYHAGNIRFQVVDQDIQIDKIDAKDQPPTENNFFPTDANGLAIVRTFQEVIAIVKPFFPQGLNGNLAAQYGGG